MRPAAAVWPIATRIAGGHEMLDERQRPGNFGRQRDQHDASAGSVLARASKSSIEAARSRPRRAPARPIDAVRVGALHVDARDRGLAAADSRPARSH